VLGIPRHTKDPNTGRPRIFGPQVDRGPRPGPFAATQGGGRKTKHKSVPVWDIPKGKNPLGPSPRPGPEPLWGPLNPQRGKGKPGRKKAPEIIKGNQPGHPKVCPLSRTLALIGDPLLLPNLTTGCNWHTIAKFWVAYKFFFPKYIKVNAS